MHARLGHVRHVEADPQMPVVRGQANIQHATAGRQFENLPNAAGGKVQLIR